MPAAKRSGESGEALDRVADSFGELAASINRGARQAVVLSVLEETRRQCAAAAQRASGATADLLANLRTALDTWCQVWPRLGAQQEFRHAVAREAERWRRHLQAQGRAA